MLEWAERFGCRSPLLLLTPHWEEHSGSASWPELLEKYIPEGSQIILHGLTHRAPPSLWDRLVFGENWGSEFKKLPEKTAFTRLSEGKSRIESLTGQPVGWFCAPRWEQSRGTVCALQALGFNGYFTRTRIIPFKGSPVIMPAISFDHGLRKWVAAVNRHARLFMISRVLKREKPFRLALHPRDMEDPAVLEELAGLNRRLASSGWSNLSFRKLLSGIG